LDEEERRWLSLYLHIVIDAVQGLLGELVADLLFVEESGRKALGGEWPNKAPKSLVDELFKDKAAFTRRSLICRGSRSHLTLLNLISLYE
jgi:hypothetical protein